MLHGYARLSLVSKLRLCLVPLMAALLGCYRQSPPQQPRTITIRENCLSQFPPTPLLREIATCLGQANSLVDCAVHAAETRESWIVIAVAECGEAQ